MLSIFDCRNFHVWNEVWIRRGDLDEQGLNGWNVIDATPQEISDGKFDKTAYERRQRTCLRGFRPGPAQTGLYHNRLLED